MDVHWNIFPILKQILLTQYKQFKQQNYCALSSLPVHCHNLATRWHLNISCHIMNALLVIPRVVRWHKKEQLYFINTMKGKCSSSSFHQSLCERQTNINNSMTVLSILAWGNKKKKSTPPCIYVCISKFYSSNTRIPTTLLLPSFSFI